MNKNIPILILLKIESAYFQSTFKMFVITTTILEPFSFSPLFPCYLIFNYKFKQINLIYKTTSQLHKLNYKTCQIFLFYSIPTPRHETKEFLRSIKSTIASRYQSHLSFIAREITQRNFKKCRDSLRFKRI